jgi:Nuclease-related domain
MQLVSELAGKHRIMLLKAKDDIAPQIGQLEELLNRRLSVTQRTAIEQERVRLQNGARAERDAAFEIDFRLKDHRKWVVIHDLRLEHKGRVAQIDHLIFHPTWEFYVLETKGIRSKLKVKGGQWCFLQNNHWRGMPSPVEQNARHIQVLGEILKDYDWLPRTFGVPVVPRFINVVLVPSDCLVRQKEELAWVVHMDEFVSKARRDFNLGNTVLNIVHYHSGEDALAVGEKLVSLHRPFQIDYQARFGIRQGAAELRQPQKKTPGHYCESCKEPMSSAEVCFCRNRGSRFAGQLLCRKCQSYAPADIPATPRPAVLRDAPSSSIRPAAEKQLLRCAECAAPVDAKVVAFCRFNSKRFGKRILCRACQATVAGSQPKAPVVDKRIPNRASSGPWASQITL